MSDGAEEESVSATLDGRMTLMEHLTELRNRLMISVAAVGAAAIVGFVTANQILDWLAGPYRTATSGLKACSKTNGCDLITTDVLQPFVVRLKIATIVGLLLASPIVLYQVWRFVTPGLKAKEKRYAIPFLCGSIVLFAFGGVVAWFTLEPALGFLVAIGGPDLNVQSTATSYVTLVSLMFLAFGLSFEFPVLLVALLLARVLEVSTLRRYRRHAIVGIVIFAAVITPSQDPYSLFLMVFPLYLFYEVSIVIGRILKR